jgi:hypothetical protein
MKGAWKKYDMHDNIGRKDQKPSQQQDAKKGKIRDRMRPKSKPKTR